MPKAAPKKSPDENDRLQAGTLPDDPEADATPLRDATEDGHVQALEASRVGSFLEEAIARMDARAGGRERPIPLPWPSLTTALGGGLWPGLHVLVGNTGSGKSQFALQAALQAARAGTPVLYIGLELGKIDLVARLIGLMSGRRWSRLYLGSDPGELKEILGRFAEELGELARLPFHLEVASPFGWSYETLWEKAKSMRARYPEATDGAGSPRQGSAPFLVVLDFLQLVSSPADAHEDLRERIGRAAYIGRAAARDLDAAVLLVSSTARDNYGALNGEKDGRGPGLGEGSPARLVGLGKESGEVEYAADSVLVLCREPWEGAAPPSDGTATWLAVAKVRAGVPGWVRFAFDGGVFREAPTSVKPAARTRPDGRARSAGDDLA